MYHPTISSSRGTYSIRVAYAPSFFRLSWEISLKTYFISNYQALKTCSIFSEFKQPILILYEFIHLQFVNACCFLLLQTRKWSVHLPRKHSSWAVPVPGTCHLATLPTRKLNVFVAHRWTLRRRRAPASTPPQPAIATTSTLPIANPPSTTYIHLRAPRIALRATEASNQRLCIVLRLRSAASSTTPTREQRVFSAVPVLSLHPPRFAETHFLRH